jgi:hypothetical protein
METDAERTSDGCRHALALRLALQVGLPVREAAELMGPSPATNLCVYGRRLNQLLKTAIENRDGNRSKEKPGQRAEAIDTERVKTSQHSLEPAIVCLWRIQLRDRRAASQRG